MSERIEGYVNRIVFRNEENGYTVLELSQKSDSLCCVGVLHSVNEGEYLELTGYHTVHNLYGDQFKIESYSITIPKETTALEKYLGSGAIKGIGQALAARIIKKFKDDTLRIIEEEPERLSEIKGISERKARDIAAQMVEKSQLQSDMIFLSQYGISLNLCLKIRNKYGSSVADILQKNPYRLAEDISGVGFKTADSIAEKVGIRKNSVFRIKSGFLYVLSMALADGNIYLEKDELFNKTSQILELEEPELEKYFMDLIIEKRIIVKQLTDKVTGEKKPIVYEYRNYYLELSTAAMLQKLNVIHDEDTEFINGIIRGIEKETKIELDELQRMSVEKAAQHGIFILTGGPGTGKTTTINTMIRYFEALDLTIALAAPTGRAAKRMQEATGYEASTIHRMLELYGDPDDADKGPRFGRNEENPIEADVIIIDETSMVDIFLMYSLLSAIIPGTRVIFVGDVNQLPSVGPGRVLNDMIESDEFSVVKLNRIFRQAALSDIVVNAHKINEGKDIVLDNKSKDFFFLERDDVRVVQKIIVSLVRDKLPKHLGLKSRDIQVLAPTRKGALGVENLNILLQKYLNPADSTKKEHEYGSIVFRENDKVMQIKNNYQLEWEMRGRYGIPYKTGTGVFNGDIGSILKVDDFSETVTVEFDDLRVVEYSYKQLDELELAYALTVHKAQGSEYPAVVMPVLTGPKLMMSRNLLYTAVTRAKSCVVLSGSSKVVHEMIMNLREDKRNTTLAKRIREMSEEFI